VGNFEEQRAFLEEHSVFLARYPNLKKIVEKAVCRPLAPPPRAEVERLRLLPDGDPQVVAFENKMMTNKAIFFLGRIAVDDFSEILILSGNGRGIAGYKILRGMYERVVYASYLDKNEEKSRLFARKGFVDKQKLAARLLEFGIDLLSDFSPQDKIDLESRAAEARKDKPLLAVPDMAEKVDMSLKRLYGPCHLEPTIHIHASAFGMERRLRQLPGGGFTYNDHDYRPQARRALIFGHQLLLRVLALQNTRFHLGMDDEIQECFAAFQEIWGQDRKAAAAP
jgi:hypothetical protein